MIVPCLMIGLGIFNVINGLCSMIWFELEWRAIDKKYGKL